MSGPTKPAGQPAAPTGRPEVLPSAISGLARSTHSSVFGLLPPTNMGLCLSSSLGHVSCLALSPAPTVCTENSGKC